MIVRPGTRSTRSPDVKGLLLARSSLPFTSSLRNNETSRRDYWDRTRRTGSRNSSSTLGSRLGRTRAYTTPRKTRLSALQLEIASRSTRRSGNPTARHTEARCTRRASRNRSSPRSRYSRCPRPRPHNKIDPGDIARPRNMRCPGPRRDSYCPSPNQSLQFPRHFLQFLHFLHFRSNRRTRRRYRFQKCHPSREHRLARPDRSLSCRLSRRSHPDPARPRSRRSYRSDRWSCCRSRQGWQLRRAQRARRWHLS